MINIAVCIGCDEYDHLGSLRGAVTDSTRTFELLTASNLYDPAKSKLLRSPTAQDVRAALDSLASERDLGVLTFYFAGHGAVKAGTYYLCCRDADPQKLSTTSLPIVYFFTVIGELQPRQVNFVIDACQAGGSMFDIGTLTKPDVIGPSGSCSIAFLAASASDQYAAETPSGGITTTALTQYLTGEKQIQQGRRYLDLVEVGLAVSRDVSLVSADQVPTAWGLNLYGEGVFAVNPHFRGESEPIFSVDGIAPNSAAGRTIRAHAEPLWEEYQRIVAEPDPGRLRGVLSALRTDLGDDFPKFVHGFASTLAVRATTARDLLAGSDALAACAVTLLPQLDSAPAAAAARGILARRIQVDREAIAQLRRQLDQSKYALLSGSHALSDLHYLPIRLSKLLAWLSLARMTAEAFTVPYADEIESIEVISDAVFDHYADAIVTVSDEQAAWTYVYGALAHRCGFQARTDLLLKLLFSSAAKVHGRFLRVNASGIDAFQYTLARAGVNASVELENLANPTALLPVLMLLGHRYGMSAEWDRQLIGMDGITLNAYVPDDYRQFGGPMIRGGNNYTNRLGHGIWSLDDYAAAFAKNVIPHVNAAGRELAPDGKLLCALSAYLYPDRVPFILESDQ